MGADKHRKARQSRSTEHYTLMHRWVIETDVWRALSSTAQALYVWLRLEWRGNEYNKNGKLRLPYSQAAKKMGVANHDTVAKAFQDLQAKGFVVVHSIAHLGIEGHGKAFEFELTELPMPGERKGRELFKRWDRDKDFEVQKANSNNPRGNNGRKPHHKNDDGPSH